MNTDVIELSNIEIFEHCLLNIKTGEKTFYKDNKRMPFFTGLYYKKDDIFFALYPTENGPIMYYANREYPLKKELNISLVKTNDTRVFRIREYQIIIRYTASPYIGFDVWSDEIDVDLFYQIEQSYKDDEFYKKYTKRI